VRRLLLEYTIAQCALHGIELTGEYPSGRYWDIDRMSWHTNYSPMPVVNGKRILLVPKYSVRRSLALEAQEYYSHHVLNFIQQEELERGSPLVRVLKSGERRPPTKKILKEHFPFSKDFLGQFSEENQEVLNVYKQLHQRLELEGGVLEQKDFNEDYDEAIFSRAMIESLQSIETGNDMADRFHSLMVGVIEFIFWPHLIYPVKEDPIHEGRKRIDITYTNAATYGFFHRTHTAHEIASNRVMVECKNYSKDPANPELDQLSGRFSINRGKLGLLIYRTVSDYTRLVARCRDTAVDGRGIIVPLGDAQIIHFLQLIENRQRNQIDRELEQILSRIIS
jgi:hypothetical protein